MMGIHACRFLAVCAILMALTPHDTLGNENDIMSFFNRAKALEIENGYTDAVDVYQQIMDTWGDDPRSVIAGLAVGNILYLQCDDYEAAVHAYGNLLLRYPQSRWSAEAARRMGECYQRLERWEDASEAYVRALGISGRIAGTVSDEWANEVSLAAADCAFEAGDRQGVIHMYEKVLLADPAPHVAASIICKLAESYLATGDSSEAAQRFSSIITDFPFSSEYDRVMDYRDLIQQYVDIEWDSYVMYAQTTRDFAARNYAHAGELAESVLKHADNGVLRTCAMYRSIVARTLSSGDFGTGAARLDSLIRNLEDPRTMPNARRQLDGFKLVAQQEQDVLDHPGDAGRYHVLGQSYLQYGCAEKAVDVLSHARTISDDSPDIDLLLGFGYAATGRVGEADSSFVRYFDANPTDATALNQAGYTLLGQGIIDRALHYFKRYVNVAPEDPNAHDSYGEGLLNAGRVDEAIKEYERAIELDETFTNSYFMLGTAYQQIDEREKARFVLEEYLKLSPTGPQAEQARQALAEMGEE